MAIAVNVLNRFYFASCRWGVFLSEGQYMFPILGLIGAGIASALTAGEAVAIGASVGAATAIGANALTKKKGAAPDATLNADADIDDEDIKEAVTLAMKIVKGRKK
jgi:hypothetical protein